MQLFDYHTVCLLFVSFSVRCSVSTVLSMGLCPCLSVTSLCSTFFISRVLFSPPSPTSELRDRQLCGVVVNRLEIVSTIWLMVCFCPQLQDSDVDRPHWCKSARQVPRPVQKRFSIDQVCRGRSKPGCRIVGSGTKDWLTTGADVHWAFMSTGVMSDDQIGLRDARRAGGWLNTSLNPGQFG